MAAPRGSRSASLLSYFHSSKQSAAVSEVGEEQPSVFLCNFVQRNLIPPLMVRLVTVFLGPGQPLQKVSFEHCNLKQI